MNKADPGRAWEKELDATHDAYAAVGRLRMRKVEPPTRTIGTGRFRRVIYLANPFLDYLGTWPDAAGRMVIFEAKSTAVPVLAIDTESGGLTRAQCNAMHHWSQSGAIAFLLWQWRGNAGGVTLWPEAVLRAAVLSARSGGRKSIPWGAGGLPVKQALGRTLHDYLAVMQVLYASHK